MSRNLRFWKQWGYVDSPGISTRFLPDETPALVAEGGEQDLISRKEAIEALQLELGAQVGAYAEQVEREPDNILASNYLGGRVYQAEENILLIKALGNPPESEMQCEHTEWEPGGLAAFLEERMNWTVTHCPWCGESLAPGVPEPPQHVHDFGEWKTEMADSYGRYRGRRTCVCGDSEVTESGGHANTSGKPDSANAPTGLTRGRLDDLIDETLRGEFEPETAWQEEIARLACEMFRDEILKSLLESSSAPTPEREN